MNKNNDWIVQWIPLLTKNMTEIIIDSKLIKSWLPYTNIQVKCFNNRIYILKI